VGQLGPGRLVEPGEPIGGQTAHVLVERVDEQPVRQVILELRRAALEDEHATDVGKLAQLGEQAGLADARLARQHHGRGVAVGQSVQRIGERRDLGVAVDEVRCGTVG
jgi:hypothetical protein